MTSVFLLEFQWAMKIPLVIHWSKKNFPCIYREIEFCPFRGVNLLSMNTVLLCREIAITDMSCVFKNVSARG